MDAEFEDVPLARRLKRSSSAPPPPPEFLDPDALRTKTIHLVLRAQARFDLVNIAAAKGLAVEDGPALADYVITDLHLACRFEHREKSNRGFMGQFTLLGRELALTASEQSGPGQVPWFAVTSARRPEEAELRRRRLAAYDPSLGPGVGLEIQVFQRMPFIDERNFHRLIVEEVVNHQRVAATNRLLGG